MNFEWDDYKNEINRKKHDGITFQMAVKVFWIESVLKGLIYSIQLLMKKGGM